MAGKTAQGNRAYEEMESKRVSLIELFYDLVFVYMISRATELLHHLHNGMISPTALIIFIFVVIVFINSWMVQTVFTNRYGKSSWTNILFSFVDMAIILYMSNTFSATIDYNLQPFFIAASLMSVTLALQYALVYIKTDNQDDKDIARIFSIILGIRALSLLAAGFLPLPVGAPVAAAGILLSWIAPGFTGKYTSKHPVIFSHLLERLTLLIIITFGETIVGIAGYFTRNTLSWGSAFIFVTVVSLFLTYIIQFDHVIEDRRKGETGNRLIYLHYPILFGISMVTAAIELISEDKANIYFVITLLYAGILFFYSGLAVANTYNREGFRLNRAIIASFLSVTILAYLLCIALHTFFAATLITAVSTAACTGILIRALTLDSRKHPASLPR